jgi:hypothetical protein
MVAVREARAEGVRGGPRPARCRRLSHRLTVLRLMPHTVAGTDIGCRAMSVPAGGGVTVAPGGAACLRSLSAFCLAASVLSGRGT